MTQASPAVHHSEAIQRRTIRLISATTFAASAAVFAWMPFMPLFLLEIGVESDAEAASWVALGLTAQGIGRLVGGPLWGTLSDRWGRKKMLIRALFTTVAVTLVMAAMQSPWQLTIALGLMGLGGGYTPASIALASVCVPDSKLKSAMSAVQGWQYVGLAVGPALGAGLVLLSGYRGSMLIAAALLATLTVAVMVYVPTDTVKVQKARPHSKAATLEPFRMNGQLALALCLSFVLYALGAFRHVVTSIGLKQIVEGDVTGPTGMAFTLSGIASALGIVLVSARIFKTMRLRVFLVVSTLLVGASYMLVGMSTTATAFVIGTGLGSLFSAVMFPANNTLIALNSSAARRGTAFGLAGGAQALATIVGPAAAAVFTAFSLQAGFFIMAAMLGAFAIVLGLMVKEPRETSSARSEA